ncbi:MAG: hypothetical protein K2P23_12930 [Lachnospiraceae bacterium]|nr:hypothetical protein [Lachnospiraceae bacterium]
MAVNVISRYNNLFNRIKKATVEDASELFYDVRNFYAECKEIDSVSARRIVDKYVEKFQQMLDDNTAAYNKKNEKLNEAKNEHYDFTGEKDDTGAVQTMLLQLMGSLPKANNKANAYAINTTIDKALKSGVIGCRAVLALAQYPAYEDMVNERQRARAVSGSKSSAQRAFENLMEKTQAEYGKQCVALYHQGARLRRLNKRVDSFMKSIREDEANAANVTRPSFWGSDDVAEVMRMQA